MTEQGFDGNIRLWGYVKVTFLCSSMKNPSWNTLLVLFPPLLLFIVRVSSRKAAGNGDPPAASPSSVFEKGNFTEGYFPVILFNYYRIISITSSLGFMIIAGM